jgi:hypothetical protein
MQPIFIKLAGIMNKRFLLDVFGILIAVLCIIVTLCYGRGWQGKYIFYMFSFLVVGSLTYFSIKDFLLEKEKIQDTFLSELVLLSEEDTAVKTWNILGKNSIVIGKKNSEEEIDIDLSGTHFAGTVSEVHAVLNYVEGSWYIEDMQSKNGTQIKGFLEDKLYNIKDGQSKLSKKDYIFIGLNKLQIR